MSQITEFKMDPRDGTCTFERADGSIESFNLSAVVGGTVRGKLLDAQLPNDAFAKTVVLTGSGWEGTLVQEPSVWYDSVQKKIWDVLQRCGAWGDCLCI